MSATEFKDIIQAISAVGFPIVMALLLFWQNTKQYRKYSETLTELMIKIDTDMLDILNKMMNERNDIDEAKTAGVPGDDARTEQTKD